MDLSGDHIIYCRSVAKAFLFDSDYYKDDKVIDAITSFLVRYAQSLDISMGTDPIDVSTISGGPRTISGPVTWEARILLSLPEFIVEKIDQPVVQLPKPKVKDVRPVSRFRGFMDDEDV